MATIDSDSNGVTPLKLVNVLSESRSPYVSPVLSSELIGNLLTLLGTRTHEQSGCVANMETGESSKGQDV